MYILSEGLYKVERVTYDLNDPRISTYAYTERYIRIYYINVYQV